MLSHDNIDLNLSCSCFLGFLGFFFFSLDWHSVKGITLPNDNNCLQNKCIQKLHTKERRRKKGDTKLIWVCKHAWCIAPMMIMWKMEMSGYWKLKLSNQSAWYHWKDDFYIMLTTQWNNLITLWLVSKVIVLLWWNLYE